MKLEPKPLIPQFPNRKRRTCMLMVTHACNLNCTYCYERFKDDGMMSFETAQQAILKEIDFVKKSDKFDELEIDFMGGEPFMNFPLIKQVVEWLESFDVGIPYITFATSNGTLITEKMKPWLEAHKNRFCVGLSYDGDDAMQATNRKTSPIGIYWFIRTWPEQGVRITISKETLPTLAHGVLSLQRRGCKCTAALAQGVDWSDEDAQVYARELRTLSDTYLNNFTLTPIEPLLTRPLYEIGTGKPQKKFCGSGGGMVTYDIDGCVYPCHMFTPLVLGKAKACELADCSICDSEAIEDPDCKGCSYVSWCPTCYGFNYCLRGDVRRRDHAWCKMIDVQVRASCEFQIKYYHKRLHEIGQSDARQVRAAVLVARMLKKGEIHVG